MFVQPVYEKQAHVKGMKINKVCARLYLAFPWIETASVRLGGTLPYLPVRLFCACTQRCLPFSPVSSPAFDEAPESKGLHFSNMFFYVSAPPLSLLYRRLSKPTP